MPERLFLQPRRQSFKIDLFGSGNARTLHQRQERAGDLCDLLITGRMRTAFHPAALDHLRRGQARLLKDPIQLEAGADASGFAETA